MGHPQLPDTVLENLWDDHFSSTTEVLDKTQAPDKGTSRGEDSTQRDRVDKESSTPGIDSQADLEAIVRTSGGKGAAAGAAAEDSSVTTGVNRDSTSNGFAQDQSTTTAGVGSSASTGQREPEPGDAVTSRGKERKEVHEDTPARRQALRGKWAGRLRRRGPPRTSTRQQGDM
jgi:hypothetical protein